MRCAKYLTSLVTVHAAPMHDSKCELCDSPVSNTRYTELISGELVCPRHQPRDYAVPKCRSCLRPLALRSCCPARNGICGHCLKEGLVLDSATLDKVLACVLELGGIPRTTIPISIVFSNTQACATMYHDHAVISVPYGTPVSQAVVVISHELKHFQLRCQGIAYTLYEERQCDEFALHILNTLATDQGMLIAQSHDLDLDRQQLRLRAKLLRC